MNSNNLAIVTSLLIIAVAAPEANARNPKVDYVIHISVDGLRGDAIEALGEAKLPNLYRIRRAGVFSDNARTLHENSVTMPNHIAMLTGRPIEGEKGHGTKRNAKPPAGESCTIHRDKGTYVPSIFDVVHDHGLRTGFYAGWDGFDFIDASYDALNGKPDATGADDGKDKIDVYHLVVDNDLQEQTTAYLAAMEDNPYRYSLVHWHLTDSVGHKSGWMSKAYLKTVEAADVQLGRVLEFIAKNKKLAGRTALILVADHGGDKTGHGDPKNPAICTIPFYVWIDGQDLGGKDLYALNAKNRRDPGVENPSYAAAVPPIRVGETGNLALDLLGFEPLPGSVFNAGQDLRIVAGP